MTFRWRVRAAVLVVAILSGWLLVGGLATGTRADAHAVLEKSVPADGELLDEAPSEVVAAFTEPPDPDLSTMRVLGSSGAAVGSPADIDPGRREMRVALDDPSDGVYTVSWRAVSQVDGHVTAGSFSFGIGVQPPQSDGEDGGEVVTSSPSAISVVARSALYWGLSLLLAAGTLGVWMLSSRELPTSLVAIAWGLAAIGIVVMIATEANTIGVPIGDMLSTATGRRLLQQGIGIAVAGAGVVLYLVRRTRAALWFVSSAAAATMFLHAAAGHAGAARSWRWFDVGVQWIHILATGLWIGGLVWLLLSMSRLTGDDRNRAVTRFSFLAGINLALIVATGVAREIDEIGLGNLDALINTSFGVALLIKTGLFVALVLFAARNRFRNVPRLAGEPGGERSVARTVAAELAVAVAVLGVTGALSQLPPPAGAASAAPAARDQVVVRASDFATTVRGELTVTPGGVGPNRFRLELRDFDTDEPVDARKVELQFSLPERPELASTLVLEEDDPGFWTADGTQLSLNGVWDVDALVETSGDSVEIAFEVRTRRPPQDMEVTRQEGQPTLYTIQLGGGTSVQAYVDPGEEGVNNVHFTFFDDAGGELPVTDFTASATSPDGDLVELETRRFSPGHYVSNAVLDAGRWEFDFTGSAEAGPVSAYFAHEIEP